MVEGLTLQAQEARKNYKRQYRIQNREKINRQQRAWRANNPEKVREYQKRYWEKRARSLRASLADYGIQTDINEGKDSGYEKSTNREGYGTFQDRTE